MQNLQNVQMVCAAFHLVASVGADEEVVDVDDCLASDDVSQNVGLQDGLEEGA